MLGPAKYKAFFFFSWGPEKVEKSGDLGAALGWHTPWKYMCCALDHALAAGQDCILWRVTGMERALGGMSQEK